MVEEIRAKDAISFLHESYSTLPTIVTFSAGIVETIEQLLIVHSVIGAILIFASNLYRCVPFIIRKKLIQLVLQGCREVPIMMTLNLASTMIIEWCEDLEELLQCPICFERPVDSVMQCKRGHHICMSCRQQITQCPICKCGFSIARNYIAEKLSSMLDNIKLSLLEPEHSINRIGKVKIISCETNHKHRPAPTAAKGVFPCRIGSCNTKLPHGRMLPHLRYFHKNQLFETKSPTGNSYTQIWELEYQVNTNFEVAVYIPKMGVFFVIIRITDKGAFTGMVQLLNTNSNGKEFTYELKVHGGQRSSSFKSNPGSCRTNPVDVCDSYNCLFIHQFDMRRLISYTQSISCTVTITHDPETSGNELPQNGSTTTDQVRAS